MPGRSVRLVLGGGLAVALLAMPLVTAGGQNPQKPPNPPAAAAKTFTSVKKTYPHEATTAVCAACDQLVKAYNALVDDLDLANKGAAAAEAIKLPIDLKAYEELLDRVKEAAEEMWDCQIKCLPLTRVATSCPACKAAADRYNALLESLPPFGGSVPEGLRALQELRDCEQKNCPKLPVESVVGDLSRDPGRGTADCPMCEDAAKEYNAAAEEEIKYSKQLDLDRSTKKQPIDYRAFDAAKKRMNAASRKLSDCNKTCPPPKTSPPPPVGPALPPVPPNTVKPMSSGTGDHAMLPGTSPAPRALTFEPRLSACSSCQEELGEYNTLVREFNRENAGQSVDRAHLNDLANRIRWAGDDLEECEDEFACSSVRASRAGAILLGFLGGAGTPTRPVQDGGIVSPLTQLIFGEGTHVQSTPNSPPAQILPKLREVVANWLYPRLAAQSLQGTGAVALSIVATGESSGDALRLQIVNQSGQLARIFVPDGVVLQPTQLTPAQSVAAKASGTVQTQAMGGYCLEFAKQAPAPGMIYRMAGESLQRKFKPLQRVLGAARKLNAAGRLHPDSEPAAYLSSIKQYALWTKFTDTWIDKTQKNVVALKAPWTKSMETTLRAAAPSRWHDIQAILQDAATRDQ